MAKYRVEFYGYIDVEADSALEAECEASFECRPDNCRADCLEVTIDSEEEPHSQLEPR